MATNFDPIGLTPIDHITAKVYLPYMLYFTSNGCSSSIQTIPWFAGDVVIHFEPDTRAFIHPPAAAPHQVPMLTVRHLDRDEEIRTHPTADYLPIPVFVPASEQRPVLRFQINVFPTKVALVMSFMHMAFDGSGAGTILQALKTIEMPITIAIARSASTLRDKLGPPAFDSKFSTEQWGAVESALSSMSSTHRLTFGAEKVSEVKAFCAKLLQQLKRDHDPDSVAFTSNDIITAALAIALDRNPIDCTQDVNGRVNGNHKHTDLLHLTTLATRLRTKVTSSINSTLGYSCSATVASGGDWFKTEGKPADVVKTSW
ncbi:uncharacterized protein BDV17DRAFT_284837 [Aspergillus undulatus]|uniref:uncharacterized protein n=1 Tax=Aspergillus undulatus TaxID=1810928 RepID=UPI003CCDC5B7